MADNRDERERATLREEAETLNTTPRTYSESETYRESETFVRGGAIAETHRQIAWSAIFAGTVVALVVMLVLNLLGFAIGALILDPQTGDNLSGLGIGAGIWSLVATLIALFFGGWVAGRVAGNPDRGSSTLHGVVTWGLFSLVAVSMMASAAGGLVGGALGVVGKTLSVAGSNPQITQQVQGEAQQQQAEPGVIISQQQIDELGAKAGVIGNQAADVVAGAAFWAFAALLLGGILAAIGGRVGGRIFEDQSLLVEEKKYSDYRPGRAHRV